MRFIILALSLLIPIQAQAARLVCIGDSVTYGALVQPGEGFCDKVHGINKGISGNDSVQGLERFKSDVLTLNPRTIIIMFGLNDAYHGIPVSTYRANLVKMIKLSGNRRVILMTPNPYASEKINNARLEPYVNAVRAIAKNRKIKLVDNYQSFAELGLKDYLETYYADGLHPNAAGQKVIADELMKYFIKLKTRGETA
jgi:acyl-CoA thioesterase-1